MFKSDLEKKLGWFWEFFINIGRKSESRRGTPFSLKLFGRKS